MKANCPVCNKEFEMTMSQVYRQKTRIGYRPTCGSRKCLTALVRNGVFNRRAIT